MIDLYLLRVIIIDRTICNFYEQLKSYVERRCESCASKRETGGMDLAVE